MTLNKTFLYLLALICVSFSCKQKDNHDTNSTNISGSFLTIAKNELTLVSEKGLVYHLDKPFSGISIQYHPNGVKEESIEYQSGLKNGYFRKWYNDGLLSYECPYKSGKQEGIAISWWKNGNLRSESNFEHGVAHGTQIQWYRSGAIFKKTRLNQGKEEGLQQAWRENGKIYSNYEAKNGRIFGLKKSNLCYELDDEIVQYSNE